jgi:hypothetical protein
VILYTSNGGVRQEFSIVLTARPGRAANAKHTPLDLEVKEMIASQLDNAEDRCAAIAA